MRMPLDFAQLGLGSQVAPDPRRPPQVVTNERFQQNARPEALQ